MAAQAKQTGKVKWFNSVKGFGFITPTSAKDQSEDLFVHQTAIHCEGFRSLAEGEDVEFTVETDEGGRAKAVNVTGPGGAYVKGAPRRVGGFRGGRGGGGGRGRGRGRGRGGYRGGGGGGAADGAAAGGYQGN